MAIIKDFIDNIFNNPPVLIEAPRAVKMHYSDVGTRVEAFNVRLFYKNGHRQRPLENCIAGKGIPSGLFFLPSQM